MTHVPQSAANSKAAEDMGDIITRPYPLTVKVMQIVGSGDNAIAVVQVKDEPG